MDGPKQLKVHRITADDSWELLWAGWNLARVNYPLTLGLALCFFLVACFSAIPIVGPVITAVITTVAPLAYLKACHEWENGNKSSFSELMAVYKNQEIIKALLPLLFFQLALSALQALVSAIPAFGYLTGFVTLIFFPLSIVASYAVPILYFNHKNMNLQKSLRLSFEGIIKNMIPFTILGFLVIVIGLVGVLSLMIGLILVALPIYMTITYLWYRAVFEGLEFDKNTEKSII